MCTKQWCIGNSSTDNIAFQQDFKLWLYYESSQARVCKLHSFSRCTTTKDGIDFQGPANFYAYDGEKFCKIKIDKTILMASLWCMKILCKCIILWHRKTAKSHKSYEEGQSFTDLFEHKRHHSGKNERIFQTRTISVSTVCTEQTHIPTKFFMI